jgi:hypothetical protein
LVDPDVVFGNPLVLKFHDNNFAVVPGDLDWLSVFKDLEAVVFVNDGQGGAHVMSPVETDPCTHHGGRGWSIRNVRIVRTLTIDGGIPRASRNQPLAIARHAAGGYLKPAYRR